MRHKKEIVIGAVLFLFCALFTGLGLDLYCEYQGVPRPLVQWLEAALQARGVNVRVGHVRVGFFHGLELDQVVVRDAVYPRWILARGGQVRAAANALDLLRGRPQLEHFAVTGFQVRLPLGPPDAAGTTALEINDLQASGRLTDEGLHLPAVSARVLGFRLHVQTRLARRAPAPDRPPVGLSIARLVPELEQFGRSAAYARLREAAAAMRPDSRAELNLDLTVPAPGDPPRLAFDLLLTNLLYRAVALNTVDLRGVYSGNALDLQDARLDLERDEYVQGRCRLDLTHGQVEGQLKSHSYPAKILRLLQPELLPWLADVEFAGPPPHLSLTLFPSALADPTGWDAELSFSALDCRVVDAQFQAVTGQLRLQDRRLTFSDLRGQFEPDVEVTANGAWDARAQRVTVAGQWVGHPGAVARFHRDPGFRRLMAEIWEPFDWSAGARPVFGVDLSYTHHAEKPDLLIEGHASLRGTRYHGVAVDAAAANVLVDLAGQQLLIRDLRVTHQGRPATGSLAWHFPVHDDQPSVLQFALDSQVEPGLLPPLINPAWADLASRLDLELTAPARVRLQGRCDLRQPARTDVSFSVAAAAGRWRELTATALRVEGEFDGTRLTGLARAAGVTWHDWAVAQAGACFSHDGTALTLEGNAGRFAGPDVLARDLEWQATVTGAEVALSGRAAVADLAGWRAAAVEHRGRVSTGRYQGQVSAASLTRGDLQLAAATADLTITPAAVTGRYRAASVREGALWAADAVTADGTWTKGEWRGQGSVGTLRHTPTGARGGPLRLSGVQWQPAAYRFDLAPSAWQVGNAATVAGLAAAVTGDPTQWRAKFTASSVDDATGGVARDLRGEAGSLDRRVTFDVAAAEFARANLAATKVQAVGAYSHQMLGFDLTAATCQYRDFPLTALSLRVQFDPHYLWVPRAEAELHGGQVNGALLYDPAGRAGQLSLGGRQIQLAPLVGPAAAEQLGQGRLEGQTNLSFALAEDGVRLLGRGHVNLREGDLWHVPVIGEFLGIVDAALFLKKIGSKEWGKITAVDADFEFCGDQLAVTRLRSDGELVAVTGSGFYWWRTDGLNLELKANLLAAPNPGFFRKLLGLLPNPFTPFLEYRLLGTLREHKWEKLSSVLDLVRDPEPPTDPTLKQPPKPEPAKSAPARKK